MKNDILEDNLSALINEAKRTWEGLDIDRERVYGISGGTFTSDSSLVVLKGENADNTDALICIQADEFLLFALRLLNKRYATQLLVPPSSQKVN